MCAASWKVAPQGDCRADAGTRKGSRLAEAKGRHSCHPGRLVQQPSAMMVHPSIAYPSGALEVPRDGATWPPRPAPPGARTGLSRGTAGFERRADRERKWLEQTRSPGFASTGKAFGASAARSGNSAPHDGQRGGAAWPCSASASVFSQAVDVRACSGRRRATRSGLGERARRAPSRRTIQWYPCSARVGARRGRVRHA
jgi:hypothetical protein